MPKSHLKPGSNQLARQQTMRLREVLQRPVPGGEAAQQGSATRVIGRTEYGTHAIAHRATRSRSQIVSQVPSGSLLAVGERFRNSKGQLARLLSKTNQLARINTVFHAYLPPHFLGHANLINPEPGSWIVQTDSPVWATRLRYCLPSLRQQLEEHLGTAIPALRIRILPLAVSPRSHSQRMKLSGYAVTLLEGAAANMTDQGLRNSLMRLARHARQQLE